MATGGWLLADGGYASFDGEEATRYLDGLCIGRPSISPAGDIWLFGLRRDREDAGVSVITP